jgi:pSer/pThr/pTyr-binding forkhead associated (FHA) protein
MDTETPSSFSPQNRELMDYLQILLGPTSSGLVNVSYEYARGRIHLHNGHVVHAEFEGATGLNACYAMLKLPKSTVHWEADAPVPVHTMQKPLDVLLMEFLLAEDDFPDPTFAQPEHKPTNEILFAEVMNGNREGEVFEITRPCVLIGSDPRCELHLPDPTVSRNHCQLRLCEGKILFTDLNSRNGTRLNGLAATSGVIKSGDRLQIGQTQLFLHLELKRPVAAAGRNRKTQKIELVETSTVPPAPLARKTNPIRWVGENRDKEDSHRGSSVLRFFKV